MTLGEIAQQANENEEFKNKPFSFGPMKEIYVFNENNVLRYVNDRCNNPMIHAYDLYKDTWKFVK